MQIVVVGIGNSWASDDQVGAEVVRRLQAIFANSPATSGQTHNPSTVAVPPTNQITFVILEQVAIKLIDLMTECDQLVVVDAVVSGARPGTLHCKDWKPGLLASRGTERASSHGFGVREVLELADALGQLPARVILWGIEVESTQSGLHLSPAVEAALPIIVNQIKKTLLKV